MKNGDKIWTPSERMMEILGKDSVTPDEVKEVIIECFCYAHGDYEQALYILKNQAIGVGMYWEKPDKEGLMNLIPRLADIARDFRNPEVIERNKMKVQGLLRKCSD